MTKKKTSSAKKNEPVKKTEDKLGSIVEKIITPLSKKENGKTSKKYIYLAGIFIVVVGGLLLYSIMYTSGIAIGDTATISFIGTYENGTVFENGSLEVTIGDGTILRGLEYGLIGIREGERKSITVEPKYGYGEWTTDRLDTIDATYKINKYVDIMINDAESQTKDEIKLGNTVKLNTYLWPLRITDIDESYGEARFEQMPVEGSTYYNALLSWWPVRVLKIEDAQIELRHEPKIGTTVRSKNGLTGAVMSADEENIVMDYNHRMAGKILIFKVTVDKIEN